MKVIQEGGVSLEPPNWECSVICKRTLSKKPYDNSEFKTGCGAKLLVNYQDITLFKWVQDCGYKGMKQYCAFVTCPCCQEKIPLPEKIIDAFFLKQWELEFHFEGYSVPSRPQLMAGTW